MAKSIEQFEKEVILVNDGNKLSKLRLNWSIIFSENKGVTFTKED